MSFKSRIHFLIFIILGIFAELFFFDDLATKAAEAADSPSKQEIFLPVSVPERNHLRPILILPVTVEAEIAGHLVVKTVGRVVVYDDPTTRRSADYIELYDNTGNLVAVEWFDRYGIERMAVDRGLLEDRDELEGVLVVVLDGEAV
jgi:Zn-dependent protease with chaperone function